ncbi:MAG: type II secretion system protein, partial [Gemmatimonadetes bacterium]|nr:type II secretion system protein [Gemmatimonadota bacterium]
MESYRTHPANRGFTLIEMVMVVVLIGVLMSVSLPFFRNTS